MSSFPFPCRPFPTTCIANQVYISQMNKNLFHTFYHFKYKFLLLPDYRFNQSLKLIFLCLLSGRKKITRIFLYQKSRNHKGFTQIDQYLHICFLIVHYIGSTEMSYFSIKIIYDIFASFKIELFFFLPASHHSVILKFPLSQLSYSYCPIQTLTYLIINLGFDTSK